MIKKKSIRRREDTTRNPLSPDTRYQQATRSVLENYKQDRESTVYSKYYEYKKQDPNDKKMESNQGGS